MNRKESQHFIKIRGPCGIIILRYINTKPRESERDCNIPFSENCVMKNEMMFSNLSWRKRNISVIKSL